MTIKVSSTDWLPTAADIVTVWSFAAASTEAWKTRSCPARGKIAWGSFTWSLVLASLISTPVSPRWTANYISLAGRPWQFWASNPATRPLP